MSAKYRWYSINNGGVATLCVDRTDAVRTARESDREFPRTGPHRAVRMAIVPDGWQVVPGLPTTGMCRAYRELEKPTSPLQAYIALLDVAPEPPQ